MAWQLHGKEKVYYRSRRVGHRVHRDYVGRGEVGIIAERIDRCLRRERKRQQAELRRIRMALQKLLATWFRWERVVRMAIRAHLLVRGFYQHHRHEWRRRSMTTTSDSPATIRLPTSGTTETEIHQLVDDANRGDVAALAAVRAHLQRNPHVVESVLNLEFQCRDQALDLICEKNSVVREALLVKMGQLELDIGGPNPSVGIFLASKRVSIAWLALHAADLLCETQFATGAVPKRWLDYRESAERRYLAALKCLEGVRSMLADLASRWGDLPASKSSNAKAAELFRQ